MKILVIDTETGGLDAKKHSLLTIGLAVYEDGKIIEEQEYFVKHKEYVITPKALEVNKINIIEHDSMALPSNIIIQEIITFMYRHFGTDKPVIAGHNIEFDNGFMDKLFKDENELWYNYVSHRKIDTCSLINYLMITGKIDLKSASLESCIEYFKIETEERHTAKDDVRATIKLLECIGTLWKS